MIKLFTSHPNTVGESWWDHFTFSLMIGCRLILTGIVFVIHAVLPFIPIPSTLNLSATSMLLGQANFNRNQSKAKRHGMSGVGGKGHSTPPPPAPN